MKQVLFCSDNDDELISASDDKTIRFWDARAGKETKRIDLQVSESFSKLFDKELIKSHFL